MAGLVDKTVRIKEIKNVIKYSKTDYKIRMFKVISRFFKGSKIIQIVQYERITDKSETKSKNFKSA